MQRKNEREIREGCGDGIFQMDVCVCVCACFSLFAQCEEEGENAKVLSCEMWNIEARRCRFC